jgi:hypothetical protein
MRGSNHKFLKNGRLFIFAFSEMFAGLVGQISDPRFPGQPSESVEWVARSETHHRHCGQTLMGIGSAFAR